MPDNFTISPSKKSDAVAVHADQVTVDGSTALVERIKTGHGISGQYVDTSVDDPMPTRDPLVLAQLQAGVVTTDDSPGLVPLAAAGVDATAGDPAAALLDENPGRVRLDVGRTGASGVVWLGFNVPAVEGFGIALVPGQTFSEFTAAAVSVLYVGTGTVRVCAQEWAT